MKRRVWVTEARISELSGISRLSLAAFRKKKIPRVEWRKGKGKGRPVEYSEAAVERVKAVFGIEEADLALNDSQGSGQASPASIEGGPCDYCGRTFFREAGSQQVECDMCIEHKKTLSVVPDLKLVTVSKLVLNKRILFAQNGLVGEQLQVIVPSSLVWSIGDPMRIKPSQQHKGYWELCGKAPRWRGDRIYRHEFV